MEDIQGLIFYLLLFAAIFYFLLIRPQQKQRKQRQELMDSLEVGQNVVTIGGIHGEITHIDDDTLYLRITNDVEIKTQKNAIGFIVGEEE